MDAVGHREAQLSHRPKVLDAVIDPSFFGPLPARQDVRAMLHATIPPDLPLEEAIDRVRIAGREYAFRIGVRVLSETVGATDAAHEVTITLEIGRARHTTTAKIIRRMQKPQ